MPGAQGAEAIAELIRMLYWIRTQSRASLATALASAIESNRLRVRRLLRDFIETTAGTERPCTDGGHCPRTDDNHRPRTNDT